MYEVKRSFDSDNQHASPLYFLPVSLCRDLGELRRARGSEIGGAKTFIDEVLSFLDGQRIFLRLSDIRIVTLR